MFLIQLVPVKTASVLIMMTKSAIGIRGESGFVLTP